MRAIYTFIAFLIGVLMYSQEVRVKFYNYSPTAYLIYNHGNGGYDIESAGELVKVIKLEELEYKGDTWLHFQLLDSSDKFITSDFTMYGFMWKDLSETKSNMNLYWDYVKTTKNFSINGFMDYVEKVCDKGNDFERYNNLGIGMKFTFKLGNDFIIKKSSIPRVDSEDKNALVSYGQVIWGIGIVRLYDIQYYDGFDMEFNKVFNLESCENQVAYNDIDNKIRLNVNNPEVHKYFKELKRMYYDYPVISYMTDEREIDFGVFRKLGYGVDLGVLCGVSQDAEAQKYLESMQKGVKDHLGYGTYSIDDLYIIDGFSRRTYDDLLNMLER